MQISENAYQQLLSNPEWLEWCRESANVSQLLERLKSLWQCEDAADDAILNFLSERNSHPLEIDITHLARYWLPYRYDSRTRTLYWCLPNGHPTEPFHDEHISHCRQRVILNQLVQPKTSLASLQLWRVPAEGLMPPAGFIFHLSRCGSTLLTGCLSELSNACVLSESQLLTEILLDKTLNNEDKVRFLPRLIHLQGCLYPGRDKIVVKWNAWDSFNWPLLYALYPKVPAVFVVRNPLEILASHQSLAGRHMSGDPSLTRLHAVFSRSTHEQGVLDFRTNVLKRLMETMLNAIFSTNEKIMLVDYSQLTETKIFTLASFCGLSVNEQGNFNVRARMRFHSKDRQRLFQSDSKQKEQMFDVYERKKIQQELDPIYQQFF